MSWSPSVRCSPVASLGLALLVACSRPDPGPALQIVGDSVKRRLGDPSPRQSALFDGKQVTLRAARGETLGVQVLLAGHEAHAVTMTLPAAQVDAFEVSYLRVAEPSTSMYGPSRGRGSYPDILTPATMPVAAVGQAWFDVAVPAGTRPGRHDGKLTIDGADYPVTLTVEPITVDLVADPLVWVFYLPVEIARAHGVADDDGPAEIAWELRYAALFRAHGAFLASDQHPRRFAPRRALADGLRYWPVSFDLTSDKTLARDVRAWLDIFRDLPGTTPFAIPIDEPKGAEARARVVHLGQVIAAAGGGRPRLLRGVTDVFRDEYAGAVDLFFQAANLPDPAGERRATGERFATYNGGPRGEAGTLILDTDGVALRTWGWIAYLYDVDLWYAWEGLYFTDRYNDGQATDVLHDPLTFDQRRGKGDDFGNGDGILAYPGPLPSVRLKALRRGLTDRLLLRKLTACGGGEQARAIARRLVPRALGEADGKARWPVDEPSWEAARGELYDALVARCPEAS